MRELEEEDVRVGEANVMSGQCPAEIVRVEGVT